MPFFLEYLRIPFTEFYFLIFLSDLSNVSLSSELFMYADDVILYKFFHPFDAFAICSTLNKNLKFIVEWFTNNSLHLNSSKSSLLIVSSILLSRIQSFDISLNFVPRPRSSFIKILGVHVDSSWIFESYVPVKCRAAYARLRCLYPTSSLFAFILSCF